MLFWWHFSFNFVKSYTEDDWKLIFPFVPFYRCLRIKQRKLISIAMSRYYFCTSNSTIHIVVEMVEFITFGLLVNKTFISVTIVVFFAIEESNWNSLIKLLMNLFHSSFSMKFNHYWRSYYLIIICKFNQMSNPVRSTGNLPSKGIMHKYLFNLCLKFRDTLILY